MNAGARPARGDALLFLHADSSAARADELVLALCRTGSGAFRRGDRGACAALRLDRLRHERSLAPEPASPRVTRRCSCAGRRSRVSEIALMEDIEFSKRMKRSAAPRACAQLHLGRRWRRAACCAPSASCGDCASLTSSALIRTISHGATNVDHRFRSRRCRAKRRRAYSAPRRMGRGAAPAAPRATRSPSRRPRCGRSSCTSRAGIRSSSGPGCSAAVISALAWRARLLGRRPAILIGSDCPVLDFREMQRAWRYLRGGYDAVVAPAEDGGYALIGLRRPLRSSSAISNGAASACTPKRRDDSRATAGASCAPLGRRSASGPRAPQIAPLAFSEAARRSAMSL